MFFPRRGDPKPRTDPRRREDPTERRGPRQEPDTRVSEDQQRILMLLAEISSIKMLLSDSESKVSSIDEVISKLPSRISSLRQSNYLLQTNLEEDQLKAADSWAMLEPSIKADVLGRTAALKTEFSSLEREVYAYRASSSYGGGNLSSLNQRISTQRAQVNSLNSRVQSELVKINSILTPIEKNLTAAESTVNFTSSASFKWMEGETPVIAISAKDMNEGVDGILTLTNQRILYEKEKETVVNKFLFIVTEKKNERQTSIVKPIGAVSSMSKGQVGFFEGEGLYIEFKQDNTSLKLDTSSDEANELIKFYNMIISGQIDEDLDGKKPVDKTPVAKRLITCPNCGAPYTDEIYRGQQTVQCKYCNARITL
jgi:DNA-directed RNA polymerase subunit RPC12/RpoP